jgi:DNA-binding NarL/FixJ family response regulator
MIIKKLMPMKNEINLTNLKQVGNEYANSTGGNLTAKLQGIDTKKIIKIILLVIDERYRKVLKEYLGLIKFLEIIAEASHVQALTKLSEICYCDILFMEVRPPLEEYIEAIKIIQKKCPATKIIVLLHIDWEDYISKIMEIGIKVFVHKPNVKTEIESAVHAIMNSKHYYCEEIADYLVVDKIKSNNKNHLTKMECKVLQQIADGLTRKEIADILRISVIAVREHKSNLHFKTNTKNDVALVNYAKKNGLIE